MDTSLVAERGSVVLIKSGFYVVTNLSLSPFFLQLRVSARVQLS